jgi:hypothetical protein
MLAAGAGRRSATAPDAASDAPRGPAPTERLRFVAAPSAVEPARASRGRASRGRAAAPPPAAAAPPVVLAAPSAPGRGDTPGAATGGAPDPAPLRLPADPGPDGRASGGGWPGRLGAGRLAPAPLDRRQVDSALRGIRGEAARARPLGPPNADVGKLLAGRPATELTVAGRNDVARAATADEAARAALPGVLSRLGGDLAWRGAVAGAMRGWRAPTHQRSTDERRARDRATHAETMAIMARVQERVRRRADSLAWSAESTREARRRVSRDGGRAAGGGTAGGTPTGSPP